MNLTAKPSATFAADLAKAEQVVRQYVAAKIGGNAPNPDEGTAADPLTIRSERRPKGRIYRCDAKAAGKRVLLQWAVRGLRRR